MEFRGENQSQQLNYDIYGLVAAWDYANGVEYGNYTYTGKGEDIIWNNRLYISL